MRPARLWEKPAQVQSTIALARSSPVESSARCTAPQASDADFPFIVRPRAELHDRSAAPDRSHRALVVVLERLRLVALHAARDVLAGPLAGLQRHRAELREGLLRLRDARRCRRRRTPRDGRRGSGPARPGRACRARARRRARRRSAPPAGRRPRRACARPARCPTSASRASGATEVTLSPTRTSTSRSAQRLLRVAAEIRLEHREQRRAGLDQGQRAPSPAGSRDSPSRSCCRYSSASAPTHSTPVGPPPTTTTFRAPSSTSEGSRSAASHFRSDVLLQTDGVRERVHREAVLGRALGAEEVDGRAERDHEVVVGERRHLRELHLALLEVDRAHGGLVDGGVRLLLEEVAQRHAPTATGSSSPVATWYSSGWNVW